MHLLQVLESESSLILGPELESKFFGARVGIPQNNKDSPSLHKTIISALRVLFRISDMSLHFETSAIQK